MSARRSADDVRERVRRGYAAIAADAVLCCGSSLRRADQIARGIGYSDQDLTAVPAGANLGVGCGNPLAFAEAQTGDTVVDLGSGAGFDALLAARVVGPAGRVIGIDMTTEMNARAKANARQAGVANAEFRMGHIESPPLDDRCADVVISNCVINLSPDKARVFREAHRILRPAGRLAVSDLVLSRTHTARALRSIEAYVGCIAGAIQRDEYLAAIWSAGFDTVEVVSSSSFAGIIDLQSPSMVAALETDGLTLREAEHLIESVESIKVVARKRA